jgi:hypothetical protein
MFSGFASVGHAQPTQFRIDSTAYINGHLCFVQNGFNAGGLNETDWLFEENGYVRLYAWIWYSTGESDTVDWGNYYLVKQFPQIGDTWPIHMDDYGRARCTDTLTLQVPAGTFLTYEVECRDTVTNELWGTLYLAEGIGLVAYNAGGNNGALTSYVHVGGSGCWPLAVGNIWHYGVDGITPVPGTPPRRYALLSSSPNPFNPSTTLSFELRAASHVSLKVYDTAGRLVATLTDGLMLAGTHRATFDGSRLASGIYLARLQAGEFTATQKLVMLK